MQDGRNGAVMPVNISAALSQYATNSGWISVDGIAVPFVQRDGQKFFPVRIAELRFLKQFVNIVQFNVQNPLMSQYMNETEAFVLSNCGCGEVFTTQDLLVNLDEFQRFYEEVKEKCTRDSSVRTASVDGGWVQINNTVVPFIVKDDSVMVSLSVVRCAAGLLLGRDVPVMYPDENECRYLNDSCKMAGISFDFTAATELVELVLMSCMCEQRPFIKQLPEGNPFAMAQAVVENPIVVEPGFDNVSTIEVVNDKSQPSTIHSINEKSQPNTIHGIDNKSQPIDRLPASAASTRSTPPFSDPTSNQQPWLGNGSNSTGIQIVNTRSLVNTHSLVELLQDTRDPAPPNGVHVSPASLEAQSVQVGQTDYRHPVSVGHKNSQLYQDPPVTTAYGTRHSLKQTLKEQWENGGERERYALYASGRIRELLSVISKKNEQTTEYDSSKAQPVVCDRTTKTHPKNTSNAPKTPPTKESRQRARHESTTPEDKQLQPSQNVGPPLPATVLPDADITAGDSLLLRRIQCYGKTITCMVKHDRLYILLEAMNRLYFPMRRLDTVVKAVTESLHVPVMSLTAEEERDFMRFYKLPAEKLNSNKVISVDDFIRVYKSLMSMLDNSFLAAGSAQPKPANQPVVDQGLVSSSLPVPIGVPVVNVSNAKLLQSRALENNGNVNGVVNYDHMQSTAQGQLREKTIDSAVPFVKRIALDDYGCQRPSKRCRTRVIGDVICIDD